MSERVVINFIGKAGAGKTTAVEFAAQRFGPGIKTFSPSDVLRSFARTKGIELRGRADYVRCNRLLNGVDRLALIRPVLESDAPVFIDGLRSLAQAQILQHVVSMHTCTFVCDDEIRAGRIARRLQRDQSIFVTSEAILADEAAADTNEDPWLPHTELVMALHDLSARPIDTNRPRAELWLREVSESMAARLSVANH
jgi:cytidylate kinase